MVLFKRNLSLTDSELYDIKSLVSQTIEKMLPTKDTTLTIFKHHDIVLICAREGNYLITDIYQYSKFKISDKNHLRGQNTPFYTAARSLDNKKETIVYIDDHREKALGIKTLLAFYYIVELISTLDIQVFSPEKYECFWQ